MTNPTPHIHPEGTFSGELISFGEIKRSGSGLYYFMMEFDTGEGMPVFASIHAYPSVLVIIQRAFEYYKTLAWNVRVTHRPHSGHIYFSADAWLDSNDEEGAYQCLS